jgi:hypothetical protein
MALKFNTQQVQRWFSLYETVHTCSETHTSYSDVTKGSFPRLKLTGCEDEHPLPPSAKINPPALELTFLTDKESKTLPLYVYNFCPGWENAVLHWACKWNSL